MKKIFISLLVAVCLVAFITVPAFAGDKQRHRWEGVAIGVGAAILGHALLSNCVDPSPARVTVIHKNRHHRVCPPARYHHKERWEVHRVWVPPVCERVWNPGHYNRHGIWVSGHWMTIEKRPGYWAQKRGRHGAGRR